MRYDPLRQPDAEQWLDLDEMERMDLVADYHRCPAFNSLTRACMRPYMSSSRTNSSG